MHSTKPKQTTLDKVAIRRKIAKDFSNGDFSKLDLLCPALDEFKYNWQEDYYKTSASLEALFLYILYLEEEVLNLTEDNLINKELIDKLISETSEEEDNLGIGDI